MCHSYLLIFILLVSSISCKERQEPRVLEIPVSETVSDQSVINTDKPTIASRYKVPNGYVRIKAEKNSFASYLRNFKLLDSDEKVHLYDGSLKGNQSAHSSILDIDVGTRDLQQCADAIMRLRAEHLYSQEEHDKVAFNFTNGWKFEYGKWRAGNDLVVKGNKTSWKQSEKTKTSYKSFRKYLDEVFMYAGTLSLSKELKSKSLESISVGDVLIQGGSPGHAVLVVDVCKNGTSGDIAFMLAQSYMPAQQIHILKNLDNKKTSPWYLLSEIGDQILTPEWAFNRSDLKSFKEDPNGKL